MFLLSKLRSKSTCQMSQLILIDRYSHRTYHYDICVSFTRHSLWHFNANIYIVWGICGGACDAVFLFYGLLYDSCSFVVPIYGFQDINTSLSQGCIYNYGMIIVDPRASRTCTSVCSGYERLCLRVCVYICVYMSNCVSCIYF